MPTVEQVRERSIPAGYPVSGSDHDNIVFLREASWVDFQALLRWRWENSGPRISYLRGEVDLARFASFLDQPTAYDANRAYRAALAGE